MATKWVHPFVVWNGYVYVVSEQYVTEVGNEIGEVTKYSDMEQYPGNFSNVFKKGTRYYSIEGINTKEAIAIQDVNGIYIKADREEKYTFGDMTEEDSEQTDKYLFSSVIVLVILIPILTILFVIKNTKKQLS
ncbi:hypothetical protein ACFFHF_16290 [Robertmurraya beringensis]|uniref:Uncharacterized protein n=1 Tax=Robertmurraya beringensis TaxID=641660 RepID=A0ABV6KUT0_9BACI